MIVIERTSIDRYMTSDHGVSVSEAIIEISFKLQKNNITFEGTLAEFGDFLRFKFGNKGNEFFWKIIAIVHDTQIIKFC